VGAAGHWNLNEKGTAYFETLICACRLSQLLVGPRKVPSDANRGVLREDARPEAHRNRNSGEREPVLGFTLRAEHGMGISLQRLHGPP
jgi:hypothetical protein